MNKLIYTYLNRRLQFFIYVFYAVCVLPGLISLSGCASITQQFAKKQSAKNFVLQRSWARHTVKKEYLAARVIHVMAPVLFNNLVIAGNEIDGLTAYDMKTGQKIWEKAIVGGVTASAHESNGILYFGAGDGFFYAVDATNGNTRWSFPIKSEGLGAPLITDGVVYFLAGSGNAYALKAESGEQIWVYARTDSANISVRGASEPTIYGNNILFGFSDGYLVSLNKAKGTFVWEKQLGLTLKFHDVDAKPVIENDRVYVSSYDGQLYCLKASNGETIWTNDDGGFTPVTLDGDKLYYSTSSRKVMALEKSSGKVLWSYDMKTTVAGQPVVHKGLVIFGEWSGSLRALDQNSGKEITSFNTGKGVTSFPTLDYKTSRLFMMTADANLFVLRLALQRHGGEYL